MLIKNLLEFVEWLQILRPACYFADAHGCLILCQLSLNSIFYGLFLDTPSKNIQHKIACFQFLSKLLLIVLL